MSNDIKQSRIYDSAVNNGQEKILEYSKESGITEVDITINKVDYTHSYYEAFKSIRRDAETPYIKGYLPESDIFIGNHADSGGQPLDGVIAEILIFDKELSAAEKKVMHYYLSKKWDFENTVDSDGDGYTDDIEDIGGSSALDEDDLPYDFSDVVSSVIGEESGLDSVEDDLEIWLDSRNINFKQNDGVTSISNGTIWKDITGNGNDATAVNATSIASSGGMYFSGSNFFYINSGVAISEYDVFILIHPNATGHSGWQGIFGRGSNRNFGFWWMSNSTHSYFHHTFHSDIATNTTLDTPTYSVPWGNYSMVSYNNTGTEARSYLNGGAKGEL